MNTTLFEKVKAKCKDAGLSEKYLKTITEKMGGSVEDDSTDETAIENMANQIADIAGETQSEATRWANAKKKEPKEPEDTKDKKDPKEVGDNPNDERLKALEEKLASYEANENKSKRESAISAAIKKHKIPDWRIKGLVVPEDQDPDAYLAEIKQDLITQNLVPKDSEGAKTVSEKQVSESATALLESITAK